MWFASARKVRFAFAFTPNYREKFTRQIERGRGGKRTLRTLGNHIFGPKFEREREDARTLRTLKSGLAPKSGRLRIVSRSYFRACAKCACLRGHPQLLGQKCGFGRAQNVSAFAFTLNYPVFAQQIESWARNVAWWVSADD